MAGRSLRAARTFLSQYCLPKIADKVSMRPEGDATDQEITSHRFARLITEVLQGGTRRTIFQPWEVEILLDIEGCVLEPRRRADRLRQYMRAMRKQLENRTGPPMKFSEFLQSRQTRRPTTE
jgi:hypothetical protein